MKRFRCMAPGFFFFFALRRRWARSSRGSRGALSLCPAAPFPLYVGLARKPWKLTN